MITIACLVLGILAFFWGADPKTKFAPVWLFVSLLLLSIWLGQVLTFGQLGETVSNVEMVSSVLS